MPFFTSENNPSPKEETLDFLRTFASLYNFTLWNIPNDSSSERFFLPLTPGKCYTSQCIYSNEGKINHKKKVTLQSP